MSEGFSLGEGMYTAAELNELRRVAREQALRRAAAAKQQTQAQEAPRAPRRTTYTAPSYTPAPSSGPVRVPASGQVRPPRSTQPVSAPVPTAEPKQELPYEIIQPQHDAIEKVVEKKKSRKAQMYFGMSLAAAALYGANHIGVLGADNITAVTQAGFVGGDGGATIVSEFGDVKLPTVARAEGLNIENCKKPGAAIATIRVTGNYALRYQLQSPENTVVVLTPYMKEGSLSKGEGAKPENKKFETLSGYPEMTIHDLPLEIYACEKPNVAAVTQSDSVDTVHVNNIEFSVKAALPAEQDNKIQTEAYMSELTPTTIYTWPHQTFIQSLPEKYTDASIEAAASAHNGPDQQPGVFNTAIQSILANASDADVNSAFNQAVTFAQKDVDNVYEAMKQGLEIRLGSTNVEWNGTISGLSAMVNDKKPTLIDTTAKPEESFKVIEGEVIVGHYTPKDAE